MNRIFDCVRCTTTLETTGEHANWKIKYNTRGEDWQLCDDCALYQEQIYDMEYERWKEEGCPND
jgi:hypothetical protein